MSAAQCAGYPLTTLFANLHLPALCTLSEVASQAMTWYNTTALMTLELGVSFLGDLIYGATAEYLGLQTIGRDAEPLAAYAPRLECLRFALASPLRRRGVFNFLDRAFAPRLWLNLANAASRIRELTFVAAGGAPQDELVDNPVAERADRRLLVAEVRRFVRDEMNVGFVEEESQSPGSTGRFHIRLVSYKNQHLSTSTVCYSCYITSFIIVRPSLTTAACPSPPMRDVGRPAPFCLEIAHGMVVRRWVGMRVIE